MSDKETDDKPTFFVSRRGRQVGVHEVDLGGIDIDNDNKQQDESMPAETTKQTRAPKSVKATRERHAWSKRKKITVLAVVAAVVLLPVAFAEFVTAQYDSGVSNAKKDFTKLVSGTVLPAQKKTTVSADQIRSVADKVNDIVGHMCRGGLLDNAAQLYPRSNAALGRCKTEQSKYAELTGNLYALEAQARYLESVDALIKPVATPITDEYAVISAQQTAWQDASDGIGKLSPPEAMKSAHNDLVTHVKAVATAWSKLNTANNSQDAADFQDAEKALSTEYEAVRQTSAQFTSVLTDTQTKVTTSYNELK